MLDEEFRLYLIEVNTNPCLEMSCPLLSRIIPEVVDNTFRLVLDPIFPPFDLSASTRKHSLIPLEFKYTLVFDEDLDGRPEGICSRHTVVGGSNTAAAEEDEIESDQEEALERESAIAATNDGGAGKCAS